MSFARVYYQYKPFIPERLRLAVRRMHARRIRKTCGDTWPINTSAGHTPEGWPGWPQGKKFALVLTHDVESAVGLKRVSKLAELEMALGFRSSFNFIPEGPYHVSKDLLEGLAKDGFEIGVHDLYHDGQLYRNRAHFVQKARRINHYLKDWGADGFRSGFMLNELDWLHDLEIQYDASTFDTDPFEPQPHGVNTIFPFWVVGPNGNGYVELPYTLPQDSTIFRLLKEPSIDIWKRKLDWIAQRGGMALLDVHPDYEKFWSSPNGEKYSEGAYADFLRYVRSNYSGAYWHALPREVAQFCRENYAPTVSFPRKSAISAPPKTVTGKILMLVENNFPQDSRVRNEAETLSRAGYQVTVIALRKHRQSWTEIVDGVRVYRLPRLELFAKTDTSSRGRLARAGRAIKAALGYTCEYLYFTTACFVATVMVALRHGIDVIHAHNPPDTLFVVALPFRLLGKKFVFDHHDLCPELYCSRLGNQHGFTYRVLLFMERCSLKLANMVIVTNESYRQIDINRGHRRSGNTFIVRNGPNPTKMVVQPPSPRLRAMGRTIICYIGCLNPQDGGDYLLRSIHHLVFDLKRTDFYCVVMGSGDSLEDLRALRGQLGIEDYVEITGFIPEEELLANLSAADICVDPDPSNPLNDQSTWIKIMEYMAYGKPIVSFDLKETRFSAQEAALYIKPNDEMAFAAGIAQLMDDPALRDKMGKFGRERVERQLQWSLVSKNLIDAYDSLELNA